MKIKKQCVMCAGDIETTDKRNTKTCGSTCSRKYIKYTQKKYQQRPEVMARIRALRCQASHSENSIMG